ncbi:CTLH/CRA C-terminal to LisH motif domain containing protein [Lactarius tabidus]
MDAALKELDKLQQLTSDSPSTGKSKTPAIQDSLNSLLQTLHAQKKRLEAGIASEAELATLAKSVESRKKEIDERQKEIYNSLARYGKALDKRFTTPLPTYEPLFASDDAQKALEHVIAMHLLRTGRFSTAETFIQEFGVDLPAGRQAQFVELYRILMALRNKDIEPALEWVEHNRDFLRSRSSSLEFYLHRSEYLRLLLTPDQAEHARAIQYATKHLRPFFLTHTTEFKRLMACLIFLPKERMQKSPYEDLTSDTIHLDLANMFATEFSASLGMSKQPPLRVVGDIGGGGALAKIEKGRKIMRERKSEWSQSDELPIEIPLPPENRYHSVFACPVSKDQSTEQNPPMMMSCGHVVSKDSLQKLSKVNGRVKCPYCPVESTVSEALRVHF